MKLEVQVAVQKVNKYATSESGDTVEIVERPNGGISVVMADGQRSGQSAKTISNIVVRKAISLIAEGVRDGAVARATHDYLRTHRGGRVSAELSIISVDLSTDSVVVSRNARCPILVRHHTEFTWLDCASDPIGIYRNTKPAISEMRIEPDLTVVAFTDGVWNSGGQQGTPIDLQAILEETNLDINRTADRAAEAILGTALLRDAGRPRDDAAVVVIRVIERDATNQIRRLAMRFPI
jgi:serine phosphatase RsbU (regulator of sigma subunit)